MHGKVMILRELRSMTETLRGAEKMPALFMGHGSPMNAIEENEFVHGFRTISEQIPAILGQTLVIV